MDSKKIVSFQDLSAWQSSYKLTVEIYRDLKNARNNNLKNQIERSSLSISSNIAEGFGRQSAKDKKHYYIMARGSAYEVQNQLLPGRDINEINKTDFKKLYKLSVTTIKLLHGLIKSINKTNANS